jgi:hypothetical protein
MSAEKSFLARWARRKRAAATDARDQPKPKDAENGALSEDAAASLSPETPSLVDPASLPPIETIGAASDIQPFLAAGVPADLTRAALRRAWSADPAIRDFVGLSENSWDFNAPGGVPGFGSLTTEEARRLLAQVTEETREETTALGPGRPAARLAEPDRNADANGESPTPRVGKNSTVAPHEAEEREPQRSVPRRRHGSALPD